MNYEKSGTYLQCLYYNQCESHQSFDEISTTLTYAHEAGAR